MGKTSQTLSGIARNVFWCSGLKIVFLTTTSQIIIGCVPLPTIASNLLAFSSKMADVAATSTDKRSVTLLITYNTRSVHALTHRAQQNLRDFTVIRPCFQQFASNCCRQCIAQQHHNNLLAIASARNTCYVAFQQIASKLLQTEQSHF